MAVAHVALVDQLLARAPAECALWLRPAHHSAHSQASEQAALSPGLLAYWARMEQRLHRPVAVADGRAAGRGAHADGFVGALAEQHFAQHSTIVSG